MATTKDKVTDEIGDRIRELRKSDASYAAIALALEAEGVFLSKQTVMNVLRGTNNGKPRTESVLSVGQPPAEGESGDAESEELPMVDDCAALTSAGMIRRRLVEVRSLIDKVRRQVISGKAQTSGYANLANLEAKLAKQLAELEPPRELDPAEDPANLNARDVILGSVLDSIVDAERARGEMYRGA